MNQEDFQVIITNDDYSKLQAHQLENKRVAQQNKQLKNQIQILNKKVKDLTRSVYIRDSFIDYVVSESDYALGPILNTDIISSDITQSLYQDVVSHQQNGISTIQLRQAMELYMSKNQRIFQRFKDVQEKFNEMQNKITSLQLSGKRHSLGSNSTIKLKQQTKINGNISHNAKQMQKYKQQLIIVKQQLIKLQNVKQKLQKQSETLLTRNTKLHKQNQALNKKIEIQGQKSYIIKLMVDQYYNELQKNLLSIGGLNSTEIGTVVANQMKGIVHYINNLAKKAVK